MVSDPTSAIHHNLKRSVRYGAKRCCNGLQHDFAPFEKTPMNQRAYGVYASISRIRSLSSYGLHIVPVTASLDLSRQYEVRPARERDFHDAPHVGSRRRWRYVVTDFEQEFVMHLEYIHYLLVRLLEAADHSFFRHLRDRLASPDGARSLAAFLQSGAVRAKLMSCRRDDEARLRLLG